MKVLVFNPWDRLIGPNRYLVEMLRGAKNAAWDVVVVLHEHNSAIAEYESMGCQVFVRPEFAQIRAQLTMANVLKTIQRNLAGVSQIMRLVRTVRPDILVSNTEQLIAGGIASCLLGIPHLKVFHAMSFGYRLSAHPRLMKAYLVVFTLGSNRIVAVSETLRQALIAGGLLASRVVTIPNPIPVADLMASSTKPLPGTLEDLLKDRGPFLLNAGEFSPKKGQDELIEVLPQIREEYSKVLCLFAGRMGDASGIEDTTSYFERVKKRVHELKLEDNLLFLGEIDFLPSLMHRVDLYVHTSWTESFSRVVAESLVCGTPVVAYDVGAIAEVAGPGAALVKKGDKAGLAAAISGLLRRPDRMRQMGKDGSSHVNQLYDAGKVAPRFFDLLSSEAKHRGALA